MGIATGDSFNSLEYLYREPESTLSKIFSEVLSTIFRAFQQFIVVYENQYTSNCNENVFDGNIVTILLCSRVNWTFLK